MSRFALVLLLVGCATPEGGGGRDEVIVGDGKADDFYSSSAYEYWAAGKARVLLEESDPQDPEAAKARAAELLKLKQIQISWFLNQFIIAKEHDASNRNYGGFGGLTRFSSEESGEVRFVEGRTYEFDYKVQIAGSKQLLSELPGMLEGSKKTFTLQMAKLGNSELSRLDYNHEWYRSYGSFDPSGRSPETLESIELVVERQKDTSDAYLPYDRLFADGEVTIASHFGHDYHARYDIKNSRRLYEWLTSNGFTSPAASYDDYQADEDGPLTKTIKSNGKDIVVKHWIFHPGNSAENVAGPDPDTNEGGIKLEEQMRKSFAEREVVIFEGHSGPLYGFALANWKKTDEGDLDDSEVATLQLPSTYQLVLANGCDTYALGQAFWQNPAKAAHDNINVITSTSFSNAGAPSSQRIVEAIANQKDGKVVAVTVSELTSELDSGSPWFNTMYGVHGVDKNPKYDPTADRAALCRACSSDADCGADGNRCTQVGGAGACTFACVADEGCPESYSCKAIADADTRQITTKQCIPNSLSCR